MNKLLSLFALFVLVGNLSAFIAEGESNIFEIIATSVDESLLPPATQFTGMQPASPNPFRSGGEACVSLTVKAGETATCGIYNLSGQLVRSQTYAPGNHNCVWNGHDLSGEPCASGIYLIRLKSPSHNSSAKLVLIK